MGPEDKEEKLSQNKPLQTLIEELSRRFSSALRKLEKENQQSSALLIQAILERQNAQQRALETLRHEFQDSLSKLIKSFQPSQN